MRLRTLAFVSIVSIAIALLTALPSMAATIVPPNTATHVAVPDNYTGWTYVTTTGDAPQATVWKWTGDAASPWASDKLDAGASVYIYPWGSGWLWGWRSNVWYAMKNPQVSQWKCDTVNGDPSLFAKTYRANITLKKYNSSVSADNGVFSVYDDLDLSCANGFKDASGGTKVYALVKFYKRTYCAVWTWECVLSPPASTTISAYVDVTLVKDDVVLPPDGTFGTIPT